jgi:protein-S-isoprenylcysteine O-methyltransferase Ste14
MSVLEQPRYIVGVLVLASYPPALLLWLAIHPFAAFWRKLGPFWTYSVLGVPVVLYMVSVWFARDTLLGIDLGIHAVTVVLSAISVGAGLLLSRQRRKQLSFRTLSGVFELSKRHYPGKLLTDGIYGHVRHPRYIEVSLLVLGYALFANYVGPYVVVLLCFPIMYMVVVLEERELSERFGAPYREYCRRVPRFVPRLRSCKPRDEPGARDSSDRHKGRTDSDRRDTGAW